MSGGRTTLLDRASRAAFWNAVLLPVLALLNVAFSIVIRRRFGLFSGAYDVLLGLLATLLFYSSLGIPVTLTKILPEVEVAFGAAAVRRFLGKAAVLRALLLAVALVPMNLFAEPIAQGLDLGDAGVLYLRILTALVVGRAFLELGIKTLNAFLAQLRANALQIGQVSLDFVLVAAVLLAGHGMDAVVASLAVSAAILALVAWRWSQIVIGGSDPELFRPETDGDSLADGPPEATGEGSPTMPRGTTPLEGETEAQATRRFLGFAVFTYTFQLGSYLSGTGFASPALALVLGRAQVALFSTAFKLAFMTVGLVVAGFQGLYRPVLTRLRARGDPEQLRRAFSTITKAQLTLLLPAGVGLVLMAGDYLPLMYGRQFVDAVPVARVLVTLMFTETAFNVGIIMLSVDERYRAVLWTQGILVAAAPFFVVTAASAGILWAGALFGSARLTATVVGYLLCRRRYGFRFPWRFAARVAGVSAVMGTVVAASRAVWSTSLLEAIVVTLLGAVVYLLGARWARVLGPEETDLLTRARFPGQRWLLALLVAGD